MALNNTHSITVRPWLRTNLGKYALAGLTSGDSAALSAAVEIINLYSYSNHPELFDAFRAVVLRMQPSMRHLAYHAIAHVLNWSDRDLIWARADLEPLSNPGHCKHDR